MKSSPYWQGVFPAITTQFKKDQSLDLDATARHAEAAENAVESEEVHIEIDGQHRSMTFAEFRARLLG